MGEGGSDYQARHLRLVFVFALCSPIILNVSEMKRANAREANDRLQSHFASTVVIAAAIIAAVCLARDENISRPSPRLLSVVTESVALAKMILAHVVGR